VAWATALPDEPGLTERERFARAAAHVCGHVSDVLATLGFEPAAFDFSMRDGDIVLGVALEGDAQRAAARAVLGLLGSDGFEERPCPARPDLGTMLYFRLPRVGEIPFAIAWSRAVAVAIAHQLASTPVKLLRSTIVLAGPASRVEALFASAPDLARARALVAPLVRNRGGSIEEGAAEGGFLLVLTPPPSPEPN
jgi:hypothetical protein